MHPILADLRRGQVYFSAWAVAGALLGLPVRLVVGTSWTTAMAFGVPMGLLLGSFSLSAWYVCHAAPIGRASTSRVALTAFMSAVVTAAVWTVFGRLWWQFLTGLDLDLDVTRMPGLLAMLAGLGALMYLLAITAYYVAAVFEESAATARRALESQIAQRDAELRALRSQVDPHFLFNSLNSIAGLITPDPAKAKLMCQLLGDFLRDSLRLGASLRIPLEREVALAEQYLRVERVRFGERLSLSAHVSPESAGVLVPPLILQPLVENAVRHGIATRLEGGTIEIDTRRAGERAVVVVSNPRDEWGSRRGTGFGLEIVRRRLEASFGDRASISVEPAAESYRVSLTIPIEEGA